MLIAAGSVGADSRSLRFEMMTGGIYDGGREGYSDRVILNLAPRVRLEGAGDRYRANLSYSPNVRLVATQDWSHAWSHDLNASGQVSLGQLTTLDVSDRYQNQTIFDFGEQLLPDGSVDVSESATYDRVERNFANVTLQHFLSPRWVVSGSVSHGFANFSEANQTNSETLSGAVQFNHTWSRQTSVGLGISGQYSVFDESSVSQGERYSYLQVFGTWRYALSGDFRIEFQGGPTFQFVEPTPFADIESPENLIRPFVYPDGTVDSVFFDYGKCVEAGLQTASDCAVVENAILPPGVPDVKDPGQAFAVTSHPVEENPVGNAVSVTFFGNISLIYEWDRWVGRAYLARRESNASGEGTASSVTSAGLSLAWQPTPKWDLGATFGWSLRQTLGSNYGLTSDRNTTLRQGVEYSPVVPSADPPVYLAAVDEYLIAEQNNEFEVTQIVAALQLTRRLTDYLSLSSTVSLLYQDTARNATETTRVRVTANIIYFFPEWKF